MACLFTLGMANGWRKKLSVYAYLLWWHLRFCPEGMGLKPSGGGERIGVKLD
jgi:hypothetical protein